PAAPYAGRRYGRASLMLGSAFPLVLMWPPGPFVAAPRGVPGALFRRGPAHALPSPFVWAGGLAKRPRNIGLFAQTGPAQRNRAVWGRFIEPQPYETVKTGQRSAAGNSCVAVRGSGAGRADGAGPPTFRYAAFFSRSCFHCPRVARLFIM